MAVKTRSSKTSQELARLRAENRQLKAELKKLKTGPSQARDRRRPWRSLAVWLCASLAGALLVTGNLLFWAGNTLVDQNRYSAVVSPLIEEPAVQTALAQYTTTQLYKNVDIEQKLQDRLPEQAQPLAPLVAGQVPVITQTTLTRIIQTPGFQETWNKVLLGSHQRAINFIRDYQGDGNISMADVYKQLSNRLADTQLGFLANRELPNKVGSVTLVDAPWLPTAHNIVVNIGLYQALVTAAVIALIAAAIALARQRRRFIIRLGLIYAGLMFVTLMAIKLFQTRLVSQTSAAYQDAAQVVSGHVFQSLVLQTRTILLIGLLVSAVAWLSGPSRLAASARRRAQAALNGNLHQSLFHSENRFTGWVGDHKRTLQWLSIGIIAVIMLIVQLSPVLILWYGLAMLVSVIVIELLAETKGQSAGRRQRSR